VLLHLMRDGEYEGKDLSHPDIRAHFDRETVLASDWYQERLQTKQRNDIAQWKRHCDYLTGFLERSNYAHEANRLGVADRLEAAKAELVRVQSKDYLKNLQGTLGTDPAITQAN